MNEIIEMILTFLMWYVIGWLIFKLLVRPWIQRQLETRIAKIEAELKQISESVIEAKVEEYHGQFYLFDKETDVFVGQGYTAKEIADKLNKNLRIYVTEGEPEVIRRFKETPSV